MKNISMSAFVVLIFLFSGITFADQSEIGRLSAQIYQDIYDGYGKNHITPLYLELVPYLQERAEDEVSLEAEEFKDKAGENNIIGYSLQSSDDQHDYLVNYYIAHSQSFETFNTKTYEKMSNGRLEAMSNAERMELLLYTYVRFFYQSSIRLTQDGITNDGFMPNVIEARGNLVDIADSMGLDLADITRLIGH